MPFPPERLLPQTFPACALAPCQFPNSPTILLLTPARPVFPASQPYVVRPLVPSVPATPSHPYPSPQYTPCFPLPFPCPILSSYLLFSPKLIALMETRLPPLPTDGGILEHLPVLAFLDVIHAYIHGAFWDLPLDSRFDNASAGIHHLSSHYRLSPTPLDAYTPLTYLPITPYFPLPLPYLHIWVPKRGGCSSSPVYHTHRREQVSSTYCCPFTYPVPVVAVTFLRVYFYYHPRILVFPGGSHSRCSYRPSHFPYLWFPPLSTFPCLQWSARHLIRAPTHLFPARTTPCLPRPRHYICPFLPRLPYLSAPAAVYIHCSCCVWRGSLLGCCNLLLGWFIPGGLWLPHIPL